MEMNMSDETEAQHTGKTGYDNSLPGTTAEATSMRTAHLRENIIGDYALLKRYEEELRLEDDPRRRAKYQREIGRLKTSARDYEEELREMEGRSLTTPVVPRGEATESVQIHKKLDALLAGQSDLNESLYGLRQAVLSRYDASEQRIINILTERMNSAQAQAVSVMLDALEENRLDAVEANEALRLVGRALTERQEGGVALLGSDELTEVISAPQLDIKHKLKFAIPIIPLLIEYEAEVELGSGMNLEGLWNRLVSKARGR